MLKSSREISRVDVELITNASAITSISIIKDDVDIVQEDFSTFFRRESFKSYIREIVAPLLRLRR
jgi:hypothetical protein